MPQIFQDSSLSQLQRLALRPVSFQIVPCLASLPSLEELCLHVIETPRSKNDRDIDRCAISGLKKLDIVCMSADELLRFLRIVKSNSSLESLHVTMTLTNNTVEPWMEIIGEIGSRCDACTLRSLEIADINRGWGDADEGGFEEVISNSQLLGYPFTFANLQPLLKFTRLESIGIFCGGWIDLDDDAITAMLTSLRDLSNISFRGRYFDGLIPKVTFASLISIAKHCPNLSGLDIAFDARASPQNPADRSTCPKMRLLQVQYSPIEDPAMVSACLSEIFPQLEDGILFRSTGYGEKWPEVNTLLP